MAEAGKDTTISKTNTGFPDYLDFTKLRTAAIEYLGNLTGKIWTDFNVHDPGITILESLIYALLDLGYRTNLPSADLFTRDPADKSKDNNFFPASAILGNNPLTITDYRKLLVDLEGVKNAWLEPDNSIPAEFCREIEQTPAQPVLEEFYFPPEDFCECTNLNGLYHVYIQLEDGIDQNKHLYEKTIRRIRDSLMSHRNLCEDFLDIKILCKLELGICAEIDLEADADAEEIYVTMVEALHEFFSPSPKFYSLQELFDRKKPIDEIFAGRPYNVTESHGFVDTEEFEQLKLRKELHLSDVYHLLFNITGIRRIRNLGWIKCCTDKKSTSEWKLVLPKNNIPAFSSACSGFIFTRNGLPEKVDLKKFESYFEMKFSGTRKAWYKEPSPFLDPELPQGIYRNDLADYYSIQNEFPKVYGISEGGLADDEPDKRKAQALQLQGFLLFFDQLLANYLTQLKNIRSLFSLSSSTDPSQNHTYFINQLTNTPQLQRLLRFHVDSSGNSTLGATGSILAYPTDRKKMQALIDNGTLKNADLERRCNNPCDDDFPEYPFCFAVERDLALNQLKDDFLFGNFQPVITSNANNCWFFYFFTSSPNVALISKHYYSSRKQAADAAASVKYAATFVENYRSYMTGKTPAEEFFSFDIELNLDVYAKYLQLIVENQNLYESRRQDFLDHLLARFAETFTDFAMLSAPFGQPEQLATLQIKKEEIFLSHYDDLSSNRGKAYDYLKNKWNNYNISGFEKRVKALAGIDNWKRHWLCNFVVEPADTLYLLSIILFDLAFKVEEKTFNEEEGLASLQSIYKKWADPVFQYAFLSHQQQYQIYVQDDFGNRYSHDKLFPQEDQAAAYVKTLDTAFKFLPNLDKDIFISRYIYKILFTDYRGKQISESVTHFPSAEEAEKFGKKASAKIGNLLNNPKQFTRSSHPANWDGLLPVSVETYPFVFIDENDFVFKSVDVVHLKDELKRFSILDKKASFQFDSVNAYPDKDTAREDFLKVLEMLPLASAYKVEMNRQTETFEMFVSVGDKKIARYFETFPTAEAASKKIGDLLAEIEKFTFRLSITPPLPDEWEFNYRSGDASGNAIDYISDGKYKSHTNAAASAAVFHKNLTGLKAVLNGDKLKLQSDKSSGNIQVVAAIENPSDQDLKKAEAILSYRKNLYKSANDSSDKKLMSVLETGRVNPGEDFIYKLVDKDNLIAYHPEINKITIQTDAETARAKLVLQTLAGYNYVDIALGDVIRERKDAKTKMTWYHFLIKCNNRKYQQGETAGQDLILFESTRGYTSAEDAMAAFLEEYLIILKYARNPLNYGDCLWISLTEIFVHSNNGCDNGQSLAFVPKETMAEFGGYEVQKILAPMAASYPIRLLRKNKYYFVLGMLDTGKNLFTIDWKSKTTYTTAAQAMQQFQFFLILLKYPGNIYIEWNEIQCEFIIYIREVLAISAHGFATAEDAWGEEGVEQLICVAQSEHGFHNYINRITCNPGFYLACGDTGLRHPCCYETPLKRDRVMDQLFQASSFNFLDLVQTVDLDKGIVILTDLQKNPLVQINISRERQFRLSPCEWILLFVESVYQEKNYLKKGGEFSLSYRYTLPYNKQEHYYKLAEPVSKNISLKAWKKSVQEIACYFPVRRIPDDCNPEGEGKFSVAIKLPGFDPCCRDVLSDDPCSSPCPEPECTPSCYLSWKTDCCFDDCCEALNFYLSSLILLSRFENYKPVYDCDCGCYGIELHPQLTLKGKRDYLKRSQELARQNTICYREQHQDPAGSNEPLIHRVNLNFCLSEIVAFNPQFYSSDLMACDAVERSKRLINSEGLHLVEHILLRPRCADENGHYSECDCDGLPAPCIDKSIHCHFPWKPGGEPDPCESDPDICFTPGCDPYSFICTVFLPAWPERFRSEAGRKIMEKLMQREAPAHVMLRILWLRPRDFCCLETYSKLWCEWLAEKLCHPGSVYCDFLRILFKKQFDPLPDCQDCIPCNCDSPDESCAPDLQDPCDGKTVLSNINELYCWSADPQYSYNFCESGVSRLFEARAAKSVSKAVAKPLAETKKEIAETKKARAVIEDMKELKHHAEEKTPDQVIREKSRLIQSRAHGYETNIRSVQESYPDKELIAHALIFLKKSKPAPDQYRSLMEDILKDKTNKAKKIIGLKKAEKQILIENITWKYLDSVCFNGKDLESILALKDSFAHLRDRDIDMKALYKAWNSDQIEALEPEIDFKKIKKTMTG